MPSLHDCGGGKLNFQPTNCTVTARQHSIVVGQRLKYVRSFYYYTYAILNWKTTWISLILWPLRPYNSCVASSIAHWSIDWREWPMTASITSSIQKIPIWERLESLESWGSLQCWAEQQKPRGWWQPLGSFPPSFLHSLCWLVEWVQM